MIFYTGDSVFIKFSCCMSAMHLRTICSTLRSTKFKSWETAPGNCEPVWCFNADLMLKTSESYSQPWNSLMRKSNDNNQNYLDMFSHSFLKWCKKNCICGVFWSTKDLCWNSHGRSMMLLLYWKEGGTRIMILLFCIHLVSLGNFCTHQLNFQSYH